MDYCWEKACHLPFLFSAIAPWIGTNLLLIFLFSYCSSDLNKISLLFFLRSFLLLVLVLSSRSKFTMYQVRPFYNIVYCISLERYVVLNCELYIYQFQLVYESLLSQRCTSLINSLLCTPVSASVREAGLSHKEFQDHSRMVIY